RAVGPSSRPAGSPTVGGRRPRLKGAGWVPTAASSPGALGFAVFLGSTCIAPTGNYNLTASRTRAAWLLDCEIVCKAAGGAGVGKLDAAGVVATYSTNGGGTAFTSAALQNSASGSTTSQDASTQVTIDLTAAYTLDFQSNFSATGNTLTMTSFSVEVLG